MKYYDEDGNCIDCKAGRHGLTDDNGYCRCCRAMAVKQTIELSLCADCIYFDAYGTLPDDAEPDAKPLTKVDRDTISPNETDHHCEGHFGYACDGCDTRLGGSRYCYLMVL